MKIGSLIKIKSENIFCWEKLRSEDKILYIPKIPAKKMDGIGVFIKNDDNDKQFSKVFVDNQNYLIKGRQIKKI